MYYRNKGKPILIPIVLNEMDYVFIFYLSNTVLSCEKPNYEENTYNSFISNVLYIYIFSMLGMNTIKQLAALRIYILIQSCIHNG